MLVLTRRIGQSLIIGDNIEIKITEISGKQVKLAINAPREIPVYRTEVYKKIQKENKEALISKDKSIDALFNLKVKKRNKE